MSGGDRSTIVALAFVEACHGELQALKPGNVHVHAGGHKLSVADFEKSAEAAAPEIGREGLSVGQRILRAVKATREAVGTNTNLGIILLAAPLAQAALTEKSGKLRSDVETVLQTLSIEDARDAYEAIRIAEPGGLGETDAHDVSGQPQITLLEAMRAAEDRDRIAHQYTHGYCDIVGEGLSRYRHALERWAFADWATTYTYMGFLATLPDTLLVRKYGVNTAEEIRAKAASLYTLLDGMDDPKRAKTELLAFDMELKERRLNPGTSADLTVGTLFWRALDKTVL